MASLLPLSILQTMSIARQLLHEFRPFIRMLDEPLMRPSATSGRSRSLFDDPFFTMDRDILRGPAVDVSEAGNSYVVEAELPGMKKENLEVRVGEGGRSLTIEGKVLERNESTPASEGTAGEESTQISTERATFGRFSRTVFLPRPVNSNQVAAKLQDGVLRITVQKAEEDKAVIVPVE
ncbi:HSP20-like chaperone [Mycena epipterygia]|nr:HSP20-like chaperone [Mycena epipterygia]